MGAKLIAPRVSIVVSTDSMITGPARPEVERRRGLGVRGARRSRPRRRPPGSADPRSAPPRRAGDDERVVARGRERVRETDEQTTPVVADAGCFAVHRTPGAHDAGTIGGADTLMPQAHTEDGDRRPEPPHDVRRNPRFARRTGPRGDDDMRRPKSLDLLVRRGVVASYNGLFSQLAHVAGQVVDERVVVVDQQDHGTSAAMSPRALSR